MSEANDRAHQAFATWWKEKQYGDGRKIHQYTVRQAYVDGYAQARAELIAEITAPGPIAYKWRTAARSKTGTPGPWHLSLERFDPVPREVDEIACYAIPKE